MYDFVINNDIIGFVIGCRSAAVSLEARSLTGWSTTRHCVVVKLQDLTVDHFRQIRNKAGALLVIIPEDLALLSDEDKDVGKCLKKEFLKHDLKINFLAFINTRRCHVSSRDNDSSLFCQIYIRNRENRK